MRQKWIGCIVAAAAWTDTDQQYSHRFDTPGTYKYFCSIHPKMVAQIVVK